MREPCPHNCGHKPLKFEVACFAAALAGIMSKIKVLLTCLLFTFSTLISTKSILPHTQIKLLSRSIFFFLFLSYPSSGQSEYSVVLTSTESQKLTISYHIHHDQDIIYIYMCVCVCVCVYIYIYIYIYWYGTCQSSLWHLYCIHSISHLPLLVSMLFSCDFEAALT